MRRKRRFSSMTVEASAQVELDFDMIKEYIEDYAQEDELREIQSMLINRGKLSEQIIFGTIMDDFFADVFHKIKKNFTPFEVEQKLGI